jgi:hypothetical protein
MLERKLDTKGFWRYSVNSENTTSGENLRAEFQCGIDPLRTLMEAWRIETENTAGNLHKRFTCDGRIEGAADGGKEVRLNVNGLEFVSGSCPGDLPITCTWALFDVIPGLHAGKNDLIEKSELVLIDDLEKLKAPVYIGYLESIDLDVIRADEASAATGGPRGFRLSGYYVYGNGMTPSYWWIDTRNNVVIASTTFQTLVLQNIDITGGTV